ncbi:hypothetical protein AKJ58_01545 [candidate division MSBL1 archaeon SCGC-AAA385D11]|uniref:Glycosyltransferase RgtA/B/C/D-like domain-containing protein n=1 Tax=candidate division MSBL1 archaeon SCGC-AAA385D11 TaxID=1698286 RepID=A0A133VN54_9EURY|nr:hypothetical protein AKJ58_01545 [candidate division MSBL1 archaeon SCGC-AAA385D11]
MLGYWYQFLLRTEIRGANKILNRDKLENYLPIIIVLLIFFMLWLLLFLSPWKYLARVSEERWWMYITLNYKRYGLLTPVGPYGHLVHFSPLYSWANYSMISITGWAEAGRIVSLFFGAGTLLLMYNISKGWYDQRTGTLAMFFLAVSPLFLQGSVHIKRATTMLFFSVLSILFLMKYLKNERNRYLLATGIAVFLSAFSKEVGIFTFFVVGGYLLYKKRFKILRNPMVYVAALIPVLLMFSWYLHIESIPTSVAPAPPAGQISDRIFFNLDAPLFRVLSETAVELAVAIPIATLGLALVGVGQWKEKDRLILFWLLAGVLFYLVFLQGSFHHTHYSTFMLPPLAIFSARGTITLSKKLSSLLKIGENLAPLTVVLIVLLLTAGGFGFLYFSLLRPNEAYEKEIRLIGSYVEKNAGEKGLIAIDVWPVYYHAFPIDINRIKTIHSPYPETIDNLSERPKIIVLNVKPHPDLGWMGRTNTVASESEVGEILSMDNYQMSKALTYFYVITSGEI